MKGLWISQKGEVALREDLPMPTPRSDEESAVRVVVAGVCATDLALARGYMSFEGVPGHEFVGEALSGPLMGERVVADINAGCGVCEDCKLRSSHHCPNRTVLGILAHSGAFAEQLVVPSRNLYRVPDGVSNDLAVFAEPLAAACQIPHQIDFKALPHDRALVVGDGRLGLLCAQVLAAHGLKVTVAGRHPERSAHLAPSIEFRTGMFEAKPDSATQAPPVLSERFALAVEATGSSAVLAGLIPWVCPRGTLVLKTTTEKPSALDLAPLVIDEISLVGSRCGPMDEALKLLQESRVDPSGLIEHRYPLTEAKRALEHAGESGVLKVLIEP